MKTDVQPLSFIEACTLCVRYRVGQTDVSVYYHCRGNGLALKLIGSLMSYCNDLICIYLKILCVTSTIVSVTFVSSGW